MSTAPSTHLFLTPEAEIPLYRLLQVPGLGAACLARILTDWRVDPHLCEQFWQLPEAEYRRRWRLTAPAIRFLRSEGGGDAAREGAEREASRARQEEIELLTLLDPGYASLASVRGLPPVLFTRGNQDLLGRPGAAIVHSRDGAEAALTWGAAVAGALAAAGALLVSSQNRDGYRRVAAAAKRAGSPLVVVLDRPLHSIPAAGPLAEPVVTGRLWDPEFHPEQELLISAAWPGDAWQPRHARERDALVIRLAALTIAGDVRPAGNIATLVAQRPVLLSPFCRAPLLGERLPESPEAAADCILERVRLIGAAESDGNPKAGPASPGWLARRWGLVLYQFIETLQGALGGEYDVELRTAGDLTTSSGNRSRAIHAIVRVPGHPGSDEEGAVLVLGAPGAADRDGDGTVLVLAPPGPLRSLQAFGQYLKRCSSSVRSALTPSHNPAL